MTPETVASAIEAVTVYRRGARVVRVADLSAFGSSLPQAVVVEGLPMALDDSSVRVRVDSAPGALAFDHRVTLDVPGRDQTLAEADPQDMRDANKAVALAQHQVSLLQRQLGRVDSLSLHSRPKGADGEPPPASPLDQRLQLVEFRIEHKAALQAELAEAEDLLDKAQRHLADLEESRARASSAHQVREHELRKAVVVSIRGQASGQGRLVIEYMVPGARWAPVYTVRLNDDMSSAGLAVRAVVAQRSGEDWNRVAVTLSTASAQAWVDLPELAGLRIGRRQPSSRRIGWRAPPLDTAELYRDWDRAFKLSSSAPGGFAPPPAPPPPAAPMPMYSIGASEALPMMSTMMELDDDMDEETAVDGLAARRPAPARAREMSAMAPPPAPMMSGALRADMAAPRAGRAQKKRGRGADTAQFAAQALAESAEAEHQDDVLAAANLLRYGDLRLSDPRARHRGRLRPASAVDLYLEGSATAAQMRVNAQRALHQARVRAETEVSDAIPAGCVLAWSDTFDYAYPAEEVVDVPSDGDYHSIPLITRDAACDARYVVVPREAPDVFRQVSLRNPLAAPLLAGPMDVYHREQFLMTGSLPATPARGNFDLGLGVEQGIKVARNARYREEAAGLMGGSLKLHHQILIEIRNNTAGAAKIEVRERIPVTAPGEEDIEIKATASPAWDEWKQDTLGPGERELRGAHKWNVVVEAQGRQDLRADYEIKISSKQELIGGNRRED